AAAKRPVKVLNAFAYTGSTTLAAAAAGAEVVHLDAAEGIVAWARENARLAGLADAPIRWIVEDITKFLGREVRRGNRYDAIILDPPSFGRGPKGEVWKLTRDLNPLLELCRQILSASPFAVVLSTHTPGITPLVLENMLADTLALDRRDLRSMEMLITQAGGSGGLPSGAVVRWFGDTC
ncbi:MAG: class I SAM-dependent methyltransferase, partial [Candidatus Tectomicrobia bacterium]|nr:class I SAM-dependent methyltransferase [Candidatus Tectomicrobia bacterium]